MSVLHSFNVDVAKEVGVNAAILLQSIKWWCDKNRANGKNYHDGLWWTYNSIKAWQELYPYLGKSAINSALKRLEERGYISTGNYNKSAYDRTIWYAITDKGLSLFGESISDFRKMEESKNGNRTKENRGTIPVTLQIPYTVPSTDDGGDARATRGSFVKPTVEDVSAYCMERGNGLDPQYFYDYQEARGWKLKGGQTIKDWKAVVRTWERMESRFGDRQRGNAEQEKAREIYERDFSGVLIEEFE